MRRVAPDEMRREAIGIDEPNVAAIERRGEHSRSSALRTDPAVKQDEPRRVWTRQQVDEVMLGVLHRDEPRATMHDVGDRE